MEQRGQSNILQKNISKNIPNFKKGDLVWVGECTETMIVPKGLKGKILKLLSTPGFYFVEIKKIEKRFAVHASNLTLRKASFNIRKALNKYRKLITANYPESDLKQKGEVKEQYEKIIRAFENNGEEVLNNDKFI